MLVLTGVSPEEGQDNEHVIVSEDGKAAVWAGVIDDLWKLGKPAGKGGAWMDTEVKAGIPSDPYLMACYDKKEMRLSHQAGESVTFTVEADPTGCGDWMEYTTCTVKPGETWKQELPAAFQARWIRFKTDTDTQATAWLEYR